MADYTKATNLMVGFLTLDGVENSKNNPNGGWDAKELKWYPFESYEGGAKTCAYGIKLDNGTEWAEKAKNGLTDAEAIQACKDLSLMHIKYAAAVFNEKYGKGEFDKLSPQWQAVLGEKSFNVKNGVGTFPKLMQAAYDNNTKVGLKEITIKLASRNPYLKTWFNTMFDIKPVAPKKDESKNYYTIKAGDNLSSIAAKFKTTVEALLTLNNIKNPNLIKADLKIKIKRNGGTINYINHFTK